MEREGSSRSRTPKWSARVAVWLMALAVVPLSGAAWFAFTEISSVNESRTDTEDVASATQELVLVAELQSRLLDERNWAAAELALAELGLDVTLVETFLGTDVRGLLVSSRQDVDGLLTGLGWDDFAATLDAVRSAPGESIETIDQGYSALVAAVDTRADDAIGELMRSAGDIPDGAELVDALRVLDASAVMRKAVADQTASYYAALLLPETHGLSEYLELADHRRAYDDALQRVVAAADLESRAAAGVQVVQASPAVELFRGAVDELLAEPPAGEGDSLDFASLLAQVDTLAERFQASSQSASIHQQLLEGASADIASVSADLQAAAEASTRSALWRIGLLGLASLVFAVGLARAIGRPLRDLASGARGLRDGREMPAMQLSGPREVQEAILALDEASGHLALAQRQASALAFGQLDSPALDETSPGALGSSLQDAVRTLAASMAEREELARRLSHEATHDSLTHLANRSASLRHLQHGLETVAGTDRLLAVAFVDLDGFKQVNDLHGHPAGDEVLTVVGQRLGEASASTDVIGRLGGDEFVIITSDHRDVDSIVESFADIIEAIEVPIAVDAKTVHVSASMGVAIADGEDTRTPAELLRHADLAVYKAKETGPGSIEICDDELRAEIDQRTTVEEGLRQALRDQDFELAFQPIVADGASVPKRVEALIRWNRPDLAVASPRDFIPVAERSDLILDVDRAVLGRVARQLKQWETEPDLAGLQVSVNISAAHLRSPSFVEDTLMPLEAADVDPARLVLEVTESALVHDVDAAAVKLGMLRDRGIQIAIDDFGTGYTSLGQLRRLPVDVLKIDRSFAIDRTATALVELIIRMGHVLGADVVAEGVETEEQAVQLRRLGADHLQGFFYGGPVSADEIVRLMRDGSHARSA